MLSPQDKQTLLELARRTIAAAARGGEPPEPENLSGALRERGAAFVTLRARDALRGCIGHIHAAGPLWESVREMAEAASTRDPRFPPLRVEELGGLEIEISVLSPMSPIRPEEIAVGTHGLYVKRGPRAGLLLPQVAVEHGWGPSEFLRQTFEKAELPPGDPGAQLFAFTVERFS